MSALIRKNKTGMKNGLIVLSIIMMVLFIVFTFTEFVVYADGDEIKDYSFAHRAEAFMEYYNRGTIAKNDGTIGGVGILDYVECGNKDVNIGNVGVFVAFEDEENLSGYITSKLSMSAYSHGYEQYFSVPTSAVGGDESESNYYHGIYGYARYGYTLSAMGFDSVSGDSNFSMGRAISGYPILFMYLLSLAIPSLFGIVIKVLLSLNPFSLFFDTILYDDVGTINDATGAISVTTDTFTNENVIDNGALTTIADALRSLYNSLYDMSLYALIPIFIGLAIAGFLLFRKNQNGDYAGKKIKLILIRLAFLVLGLPLLGSVYTTVLMRLNDTISAGSSATTTMICATFVDFEAWASNMRLAPPDNGNAYIGSVNATKDNPVGDVDDTTMANLRNLCGRINIGSGAVSGLYSTSQLSSVIHEEDASNWDTSTSRNENESASSIDTSDVINLLLRYTNNEFYLAGAYETRIKSEMETCDGSNPDSLYAVYAATNNGEKDLHVSTNDGKCDMNGGNEDFTVTSVDILTDMSAFAGDSDTGYEGNIFANGALSAKNGSSEISWSNTGWSADDVNSYSIPASMHFINSSNSDVGTKYTSSVSTESWLSYTSPEFRAQWIQSKLKSYTGLAVDDNGGLSSMSIFNYLNTEFKSQEMVCYSPDSASNFVRKQHHSVNLIGTGFMSFLYWLNLMALCGGIAIIGIGYAFAIIVSNIRRSWQIIFNMPLAMMGALQAIAKLITYTLVMIVEVIMTIFMYHVMEEFMLGVSAIVEKPFSLELANAAILPTDSILAGNDIVTTMGSGITCATGFTNTITISLMLMISSAILIWITINAFRFRKAFVKSVDEMAAKVINKFVTGNDAGLPSTSGGHARHNNGPSIAPAIAQGAAQGAMMHSLDKKRNGDSNNADKRKNADASKQGSGEQKQTSQGDEAKDTGQSGDTENISENTDNAAMDAESADSSGHTDSDDKQEAESMAGSPTGNKDVSANIDSDKTINASEGDKSMNSSDNSTSVTQEHNVQAGDSASSDQSAGQGADDVQAANQEAAAAMEAGAVAHAVEGGDAATNENDTQSDGQQTGSETATASDVRSVEAGETAGQGSTSGNDNTTASPNASGGASGSESASGEAGGGSEDSNTHNVQAQPLGKKAQRLQAKYEKKDNKQKKKDAKKEVKAAESKARKTQDGMIKANTEAAKKSNVAQRKANVTATAEKARNAQNEKAKAKANLDKARQDYRAALDSGSKEKAQKAKVNLVNARENFQKANQASKIANAEKNTAARMSKSTNIAASNAMIGAKGAVQRLDNQTPNLQHAAKTVGGKVATAGKSVASAAPKAAKTAGKVAGTAAIAATAVTGLAVASTIKTVENVHDELIDDTF